MFFLAPHKKNQSTKNGTLSALQLHIARLNSLPPERDNQGLKQIQPELLEKRKCQIKNDNVPRLYCDSQCF